MQVPPPRQTRFDLRWTLFGVPVRVGPLFWVSSAVLGVRHYADPETGTFGWFLFWMAAALVSVLFQEWGHVLAGRLCGMRPEVVLYGLGGLTLGIDALPRRGRRIVVLLAGPLAGLLVVAGIWGLTFLPLPATWGEDTRRTIVNAVGMLFLINYWWAILNLLPLWPLDGGRAACEIGEGLLGPRGLTAALSLCLVDCGLLAALEILLLCWHLDDPFDPRYLLWLMQYSALLLFCFLLWLRTFRALWPEQRVA